MKVFERLRNDLRRGRADYFANPTYAAAISTVRAEPVQAWALSACGTTPARCASAAAQTYRGSSIPAMHHDKSRSARRNAAVAGSR